MYFLKLPRPIAIRDGFKNYLCNFCRKFYKGGKRGFGRSTSLIQNFWKNAKRDPYAPIHPEMKRTIFSLYRPPLSHSPTKKSEWPEGKICFYAFLAKLGCEFGLCRIFYIKYTDNFWNRPLAVYIHFYHSCNCAILYSMVFLSRSKLFSQSSLVQFS